MTTKTSFQEGGQSSFLHGSYQRETVEKTSSSSLVRAEYVKTTSISEDVQIGGKGNVETEERKGSFLYSNDTVKKNENAKEKEKEPVSSIGSNVTGIQISSRKSSDSHQFLNNHAQSERALTRENNSVEKATTAVDNERNMKRNVNESFL